SAKRGTSTRSSRTKAAASGGAAGPPAAGPPDSRAPGTRGSVLAPTVRTLHGPTSRRDGGGLGQILHEPPHRAPALLVAAAPQDGRGMNRRENLAEDGLGAAQPERAAATSARRVPEPGQGRPVQEIRRRGSCLVGHPLPPGAARRLRVVFGIAEPACAAPPRP